MLGRVLTLSAEADMWYSLQLCCLCRHNWALIRFYHVCLICYLPLATIPIKLCPRWFALRRGLKHCCLCNSRSVAWCFHTLHQTLDYTATAFNIGDCTRETEFGFK